MKSQSRPSTPLAPAAVISPAPETQVQKSRKVPNDGARPEPILKDGRLIVPLRTSSEPSLESDDRWSVREVPTAALQEDSADAPEWSSGVATDGIYVQKTVREPTPEELENMQKRQATASLSARLGQTSAVMKTASVSIPRGDASRTVEGQSALPPASVGPLSLRTAAANGDPSAAFEVGARFSEGRGTDQNFKEAIHWYQQSASQGFAQAQFRLGTFYERGLGVKGDSARARLWYRRAAEQGNVKAMHNLAVLLAGRENDTPDYMSAAEWFSAAAEYGLADSQYNLAVLHENGLGVAKDRERAFKWYSLASRSGDREATHRRDALASSLPPQARQAILREVEDFVPRVAGEDWKSRSAS